MFDTVFVVVILAILAYCVVMMCTCAVALRHLGRFEQDPSYVWPEWVNHPGGMAWYRALKHAISER